MEDLKLNLSERLSDRITSLESTPHNELVIHSLPQDVPAIVEFLKLDRTLKFSTLIDITAVDYPSHVKRFELVYHFLSMYMNHRVRLKTSVKEGEIAPSITHIHKSANWFEREVFDMYGVMFSDHPDLRRILTDYGFKGYPLRKDFPTTGYVELRYDEVEKRCVYEAVNLTQEYRQFDFMSPWEGADYILPGDEHATREGGAQ